MKLHLISSAFALLAIVSANVADARPHDRDGNPPGPVGGRGTNWENPPGPAGGPGASPDRRRHDRDGNPPGPVGGPGTNWENPPGPAGGPGASPDRHPRILLNSVYYIQDPGRNCWRVAAVQAPGGPILAGDAMRFVICR